MHLGSLYGLVLDPDFKKNVSDVNFRTSDFLSERILEGFVKGY